jgi:hypothetical protein
MAEFVSLIGTQKIKPSVFFTINQLHGKVLLIKLYALSAGE